MVWIVLALLAIFGMAAGGVCLWLWAADDERRLDYAYRNATSSFGDIWHANKLKIKRARIASVLLMTPLAVLLVLAMVLPLIMLAIIVLA